MFRIHIALFHRRLPQPSLGNYHKQCKILKEFTRTLVPFLQRSDECVEMKHLLLFQRGSNDETVHCSGTQWEERGLSGALTRWRRVEGGWERARIELQLLRWKSMILLKSVSKAVYLFCSGPGGGRSLALSARVLVREDPISTLYLL